MARPNRRAALGALLAAPVAAAAPVLSGDIIGWPIRRRPYPDLTGPAEGWLRDAYAVGMALTRGPGGDLWRYEPIGDGEEREAARKALLIRLYDRPGLYRAVRRVVLSGFKPWEVA